MWDAITYSWLGYLLLATKASFMHNTLWLSRLFWFDLLNNSENARQDICLIAQHQGVNTLRPRKMAATFGRRHFRMQFRQWNGFNFDKNYTSFCFQLSNLRWPSISLDNGLAPKRRHAIVCTNADPIHWRIYAELGRDQLISKITQTRHAFFLIDIALDAMMTSSNGNSVRVTGPLGAKFTGHWWIPLTEASDAELWCFLWYVSDQTVK